MKKLPLNLIFIYTFLFQGSLHPYLGYKNTVSQKAYFIFQDNQNLSSVFILFYLNKCSLPEILTKLEQSFLLF